MHIYIYIYIYAGAETFARRRRSIPPLESPDDRIYHSN